MDAKGTTFENDLLKLIFNAVPIANLADNAGSSPLALLYVALHTATPAGGNQSTNECAYTPYIRQSIARTSGGWVITGNSVSPAAAINFPAWSSGSTSPATHWSVGVASSGASKMLYYGPLNTPISIDGSSLPPQLLPASAITET